MKALVGVVFLVVAAGCANGRAAPSGTPVDLVTYNGDGASCYTNAEPHLLVPDPQAGTAMVMSDGSKVPLAWPTGYVARQDGAEVDVYTNDGALAARTGKAYYIAAFGNADQAQVPFPVGCASRLAPSS